MSMDHKYDIRQVRISAFTVPVLQKLKYINKFVHLSLQLESPTIYRPVYRQIYIVKYTITIISSNSLALMGA